MIQLTVHYFVDIDECASSPCHNAGTCTDIVNGYTCACAAGYNGDNCQTGLSRRDCIVVPQNSLVNMITAILRR